MIPALLLGLTPFVAQDAGLRWSLEGKSIKAKARYDLTGKELRGEVHWFVAPQGRFDPEGLYRSDTERTKEADESKGFTHVRSDAVFAGVPAIRSDQWYAWNGSQVASRCLYAAQGHRAWIVRLWWPPRSAGAKEADAFLKSVRLLGNASASPTRSPSR